MSFTPCSKELFFQRNEKDDPRWGEKVSIFKGPEASAWILRGYPDEEGIALNGGRPGASQGPDSIRRMFYKTTWPQTPPRLMDQGNLDVSPPLSERHQIAQQSLTEILKAGSRVISLGGGHDYGYPDGAGFLSAFPQPEAVVINFDAHLDVRPLDRGLSSGTPFFRLLSNFSNFHFFQIGIQPQCNSASYRNWCEEKGGKILDWPQVLTDPRSFSDQVAEFLSPHLKGRPPAFISLDIDCFNNATAPGCSQSWSTGLGANQFYPVLELLKQRLDIRVFGIYEVSPPLDLDFRTSKLAAQWIHQLLSGDPA